MRKCRVMLLIIFCFVMCFCDDKVYATEVDTAGTEIYTFNVELRGENYEVPVEVELEKKYDCLAYDLDGYLKPILESSENWPKHCKMNSVLYREQEGDNAKWVNAVKFKKNTDGTLAVTDVYGTPYVSNNLIVKADWTPTTLKCDLNAYALEQAGIRDEVIKSFISEGWRAFAYIPTEDSDGEEQYKEFVLEGDTVEAKDYSGVTFQMDSRSYNDYYHFYIYLVNDSEETLKLPKNLNEYSFKYSYSGFAGDAEKDIMLAYDDVEQIDKLYREEVTTSLIARNYKITYVVPKLLVTQNDKEYELSIDVSSSKCVFREGCDYGFFSADVSGVDCNYEEIRNSYLNFYGWDFIGAYNAEGVDETFLSSIGGIDIVNADRSGVSDESNFSEMLKSTLSSSTEVNNIVLKANYGLINSKTIHYVKESDELHENVVEYTDDDPIFGGAEVKHDLGFTVKSGRGSSYSLQPERFNLNGVFKDDSKVLLQYKAWTKSGSVSVYDELGYDEFYDDEVWIQPVFVEKGSVDVWLGIPYDNGNCMTNGKEHYVMVSIPNYENITKETLEQKVLPLLNDGWTVSDDFQEQVAPVFNPTLFRNHIAYDTVDAFVYEKTNEEITKDSELANLGYYDWSWGNSWYDGKTYTVTFHDAVHGLVKADESWWESGQESNWRSMVGELNESSDKTSVELLAGVFHELPIIPTYSANLTSNKNFIGWSLNGSKPIVSIDESWYGNVDLYAVYTDEDSDGWFINGGTLEIKVDPNKDTTVSSTEQTTKQSTELVTEQSTVQSTEKVTEQVSEQATEQSTEVVTEQVSEQALEQSTERSTESVTESSTEQASEQITELVTESSTEQASEQASEQITEQVSEQALEQASEQITEQVSEQITTQSTEQATLQSTTEVKVSIPAASMKVKKSRRKLIVKPTNKKYKWQVQISKSKKFTKCVVNKIVSKKQFKTKKLKKGKYYVRIRYKNASQVGKWSKTKSVKIK